MEYREINEDSKLIYYVVDNMSQMADMDHLYKRYGGRILYSAESTDYLSELTTQGILYLSVFMIFPPDPYLARVFMGHGISDKPIAKFASPRNFSALDYYNVPGIKYAWHFDHYGHQISTPYDKKLKFGMPVSDYFLNKEMDLRKQKPALLKKYRIETDRPIVLFSPSFNSEDLAFYHRLFVEQFKDKYYFVTRCHDREMTFDEHPYPNTFMYKGMNNPAELIAISDYYIGDGSSIDNIAIYADIPMVLVKPQKSIAGDVPYEFDMRNYTPYFAINTDGPFKSILTRMEEASTPEAKDKRWEYINQCFDYNDGNCIERMCKRHEQLMGVIKDRMAGRRDPRMDVLVKMWDKLYQGKGLMDLDRDDDVDYAWQRADCI